MSFQASDVALRLGHSDILQGVSLTAQAGQFTAIIGANGSGKTTFLRALTGEIIPYRGDITLNGHKVSETPPEVLAKMRAVLPQFTSLSFPFTAAEVVRIGLTAYQGPGTGHNRLIEMALARVGLQDYGARLYQELSGGEQQRVQLARTLAQVMYPVARSGPRWLLMDEPVSSLDIAHQLVIMRLAAEYARQGGGVIAIMHDLNLTSMFADHVLLMHRGRAIAEGPPVEVMNNDLLSAAYGCRLRVSHVPNQGVWILPQGAEV